MSSGLMENVKVNNNVLKTSLHRCCEDGCCPTVILDSIMNVDIHVAMVSCQLQLEYLFLTSIGSLDQAISLTVICMCVVTGIVIIICCFVSSCPCYDTLSGGWAKGEPVQVRILELARG